MAVPELLAGIRVLDLAGEAAVLTARLLADLGADVIRIEAAVADSVRRRSPLLDGGPEAERSLYHQHFNRNKRSLTLELEREADREKLRQLALMADALIETAPPGRMDALGIGYAALSKVNPGLVYTTVTPFGQEGPFRDYLGTDITGAAASGLLYLNGFPDDPPNQPGAEQAYKMASLVAATATLMALYGRGNGAGRRGRRVDVSVQEAASMATTQTANANIYTWHGRIPRRMGGFLQKCGDGEWISFTLRTGSQETWSDLTDWLRDEQIDTPVLGDEWRDEAFRVGMGNRRLVTEAIAALCAKHDRAYIFHEGQKRKQLVMPVNAVVDLLESEQLQHRQYFVSYPHPELGLELTDSGLPYKFNNVAYKAHRRAPLLGEHTAEVLAALKSAQPSTAARAASGASFNPVRPLEGLRVADFAWMIAGPASSRMLADFGAEVIKIESQYRVDNIRVVGVQPAGEGSLDTNGVFNDHSTNKLSVRLNANNPKGLALIKEIIRHSDIVLNNYTAERMPRWGLGYEDLRKIKPDIIMLSMPVMGSSGPYRQYGSYGNGVIAYGGLNTITGFPSRPPVGLGPLYSDFAAPYLVVTSIMAALLHRQHSGIGQFIDFAQVESTVSLLGTSVLEYTAKGVLPARPGNRSPDYAPHGVYPCYGDDRWVAIAVTSDLQWWALAEAIGGPELAADARYAGLGARKEREDEIDALISGWTRQRDAWQVMHTLQGHAVPAAVVEDLEDMVVRDPWLSTRHLTAVPFPEAGIEFRTHNEPMRMDGQVPPLKRAPRFGEHSEQVLKGLLGLTDEQYEELLIEQVVF
jgi:crotonobetainyl-CoA:carnitine CoA-transferase CaiB-like acyl-CoA transferase